MNKHVVKPTSVIDWSTSVVRRRRRRRPGRPAAGSGGEPNEKEGACRALSSLVPQMKLGATGYPARPRVVNHRQGQIPTVSGQPACAAAEPDQPALVQHLGDLDRVGGRALEQVVADDPQAAAPRSCEGSRRRRPTKTSSRPAARERRRVAVASPGRRPSISPGCASSSSRASSTRESARASASVDRLRVRSCAPARARR